MNSKKPIFFSILFMVFGLSHVCAQESNMSAGGEAIGSGGIVSYSLGQVAYTVKSGSDGKINEGVQQPYEIYVITDVGNLSGIKIECSAFPNPTTNFLTLQIDGNPQVGFSYALFDITGKLLANKNISSKLTQIKMAELVSATYFLQVSSEGEKIKTFKIIKK